MAVPAWFDYQVYRTNKIAELEDHGSHYDSITFAAAFQAAGFTNDAEGLYAHFQSYGKYENVSPNAQFDPDYYFQAKAAKYFGLEDAYNQVTAEQVKFIKDAFAKAGISAWDHYTLYGMKEGIDPNANFNTTEYLNAKLAALQETDASWTYDGMVDFFKSMGLNPVSHYWSYGKDEGLTYVPATHAGVRQELTVDADNLVGTMGDVTVGNDGDLTISDNYNDYFNAEVVSTANTLQSEDIIDGKGGQDTLYARVNVDVESSKVAGEIEPTVKDVEKILFRSQIGAGDDGANDQSGYYAVVEKHSSGDNDVYGTVSAVIDADRISFTDETTNLVIGSDNSRADLTIEDLRHDSNYTTVRFADADPGVNYYLYFDPQHLKANSQSQTGILNVEIMDVKNGQLHDQPLRDQPFDTFSFGYKVNGKEQLITLSLNVSDKSNYTGTDADYDSLLTAFQEALAAYENENPSMKGVFDISLGTQWKGIATTGRDTYEYDYGKHITITAKNGTVFGEDTSQTTGTGWAVSQGTVPAIGGIVWDILTDQSTDCPLIEVGVQLDNVGRVQWDDVAPECLPDDIIYGSNAGDLQIGSMALRGGVERMDVTVDRGSWLKGLYSTNDTLRMVTVNAEDINEDGVAGYVNAEGVVEQGQLYIGTWEGNLDEEGNPPSNLTWTDAARLLTAEPGDQDEAPTGLKDVAVFDAQDYEGQINIAAQITAESYDKYLKDVDGSWPMGKWAPIAGYDGKFTYLTGSNDDTVNMTVEGDIAADVDFKLNINTGAGNDLVGFRFTGMSENQEYNQRYLRNVDINTGDGNDHVWFYSEVGFVAETENTDKVVYTDPDGVEYTKQDDGSWVDSDGNVLDSVVWENETYSWNAETAAFTSESGATLDLENDTDNVQTITESNTTYTYSGLTGEQGSVNVNAGAGRDVVYSNQVELTTGGADTTNEPVSDSSSEWLLTATNGGSLDGGVREGAGFYNTVYAFNTSNEENWIGLYSDDDGVKFEGATLNNDIMTGDGRFSFASADFNSSSIASQARSLYVTVEFMGFKGAAEIGGFSMASSTSNSTTTYYATVNGNKYVNATTLNHAFMDAIENDTSAMRNHSLSDVLVAKDGAGHSLLIESLINGVHDLEDIKLGFEVRNADNEAILSDSQVFSNAEMYTSSEYAIDEDGAAYTGHDYMTASQSVIDAGTGNDVIVLNRNGESEVALAKDVIVLKENFGNDVVFDFQSGTDKINVSALGVNGAAAATSATALKDDTVYVLDTKYRSQSDVQKLADDKAISFVSTEDEGSTAIIALHSGQRYTLALATKTTDEDSSDLANAEISILGSLTLDDASSIEAGDFTTSNSLL